MITDYCALSKAKYYGKKLISIFNCKKRQVTTTKLYTPSCFVTQFHKENRKFFYIML